VEMMGGMGFIKDNPVEKFYRDSKIGEETTSIYCIEVCVKYIKKNFALRSNI